MNFFMFRILQVHNLAVIDAHVRVDVFKCGVALLLHGILVVDSGVALLLHGILLVERDLRVPIMVEADIDAGAIAFFTSLLMRALIGETRK